MIPRSYSAILSTERIAVFSPVSMNYDIGIVEYYFTNVLSTNGESVKTLWSTMCVKILKTEEGDKCRFCF